MTKKIFFATLCTTLVLWIVMASGCRPAQSKGGKPLLIVSIAPLQYLFEHLARGRMEVQALVPRGASPETFEPTPAHLVALRKATAYVGLGLLPFEQTWSEQIAASCPNLPQLVAAQGLTLAGNPAQPDPHVWMSPHNMAHMARSGCRFLCQIDPDHASLYQANLDSLLLRLRTTDRSVRALLSNRGIVFMAYHPTLTYFARDYGLTQIPIEENGKEPSARRYAQLARKARELKAEVIFTQPEQGTRPVQWLASETGIPIEIIDPLDAHWERALLRTATLLARHASQSTHQP